MNIYCWLVDGDVEMSSWRSLVNCENHYADGINQCLESLKVWNDFSDSQDFGFYPVRNNPCFIMLWQCFPALQISSLIYEDNSHCPRRTVFFQLTSHSQADMNANSAKHSLWMCEVGKFHFWWCIIGRRSLRVGAWNLCRILSGKASMRGF